MDLFPLFLNLAGRTVVLVGGGPVATAKLRQLLAAGAQVRVIAPEIADEIQGLVVARPFQGRGRGAETPAPHQTAALQPVVTIARRPFVAADLDEAWLVVAAATPEVNRHVADVAEKRRLFVNAVDDPGNASAFLSGVIRRDGVTLAISTNGAAPALTALLREGLDALLPRDLAAWMWRARAARVAWRREGVPMDARKPRLLQALNNLYRSPEGLRHDVTGVALSSGAALDAAPGFGSDMTPGPRATSDVASGSGVRSDLRGFGASPDVVRGFDASPDVVRGFDAPSDVAQGFRACEQITYNAETAEPAVEILKVFLRALRVLRSTSHFFTGSSALRCRG